MDLQKEITELKATAYDITMELNRLSAILQQVNATIQQKISELESSKKDEELTKPLVKEANKKPGK
jgi:hypothetical protein